ncbi:MAG: baseplate assembly protein [Pseudomonadota bacterium]
MPDSVGFDRRTGKVITDWDHASQSITVIVTTLRGTRVQRRDFGSDDTALVDAPMNDRQLVAFFTAVAEALEPRLVEGHQLGEPRFLLRSVSVIEAGADGGITIGLVGYYVPRGHLGDTTIEREVTLEIEL